MSRRMTRRRFLGDIAGLASSASLMPPTMSSAVLGGAEFLAVGPREAASTSEWQVTMVGQGWSPFVAQVSSTSTAQSSNLAPDVSAQMREHLAGRVTILDGHSWLPPPENGFFSSLNFTHLGANDVQVRMSFHDKFSINAIPTRGTMERAVWRALDFSFEEAVSRAVLGSWFGEFPMNVDSADLHATLGECSSNCVPGAMLSAISMAALVDGNEKAIAQHCVTEIRQTLSSRGFTTDHGYFTTIHTRDSLDAYYRMLNAMDVAVGPSTLCALGHDFDDRLSQPFVTVMGSGVAPA